MRKARDLDDFLAAPVGAWLGGASFAFFNLGTVCGWRVWGQPTREDARTLVASIATAYAPGAPPYYSLVDLRALEGVDGAGFEVLHDWVKGHRDQMGTRLLRQAVVRPTGLVGALAAGFYELLQPRHRVRVFDSVSKAAAWLSPEDSVALAQLVAAYEARPAAAAFAATVRAWLGTRLLSADPEEAARALGLSLRTMQRRLKDEATSWEAELGLARIEQAQRLLVDTDWKLAAIAHEVGFPSSQQFATSFKARAGMTPSDFRRRYRAAGKLDA